MMAMASGWELESLNVRLGDAAVRGRDAKRMDKSKARSNDEKMPDWQPCAF